MWKPEHRVAADRRGLRYASDLSDAEWAIIAPMIPPAKRGGWRREVDVREVLNAIFYVLWTGCQWKALPKDLPSRSTVWDYFDLWSWDGTMERVHEALYVESDLSPKLHSVVSRIRSSFGPVGPGVATGRGAEAPTYRSAPACCGSRALLAA